MANRKLKIAIFDLTDCEGCEAELTSLGSELVNFSEACDIVNWRLGSDNSHPGPFDLTFIEGTPITEADIETIKQLRANSALIVSLGSCADLGGVQGYLSKKEWEAGIKAVYGKDYKTTSKPPRPLSYYIQVDHRLPGCPVNRKELAQFIASFLIGKKPTVATYPVCLECKANENTCLLLEGQPCLGPITKGGCEAICPKRGLRCWGCFGALEGGNPRALKTFFEKSYGKDRTKQLLRSFFANQDEYRALYPEEFSSENAKKDEKMVKLKVEK